MSWKDLKSSNLKRARYINEGQVLEVEFHKGGHYEYTGVPEEVFKKFCNAKSPGHFFYSKIRGQFKHSNLKKKGEK